MSTSRIEIPLTLPPPHFDDDATIATARQVVPIKGRRRSEKRRKIVALLPVLIASTLCGALGAIAVNYFEQRREAAASVTQQQPLPGISTQAKTGPPTVAAGPELNSKQTQIQASVQPAGSTDTPADKPLKKMDEPRIAKSEESEPKSAPPAAEKRDSAQEAAKLVRKRRVSPADPEIPIRRNRRTEASRIEDLFTGPNP